MKGLDEMASYRVRDNFFSDKHIMTNNGDGYNLILGGLVKQSAQAYDPFVTEDLTNFLLRQSPNDFGADLIARNLQRGRDHGLQGYNAYRDLCNLPSVTTWENRPKESLPNAWEKLKGLYKNPVDIDLFTGGLIEEATEGALTGPTFNCLKGKQFQRLKAGDRFFFTHRGQTGSFGPTQLKHLMSRKFSDIICDNSNFKTVPVDVYRTTSASNPRIDCNPKTSPTRTVLNVALLLTDEKSL